MNLEQHCPEDGLTELERAFICEKVHVKAHLPEDYVVGESLDLMAPAPRGLGLSREALEALVSDLSDTFDIVVEVFLDEVSTLSELLAELATARFCSMAGG